MGNVKTTAVLIFSMITLGWVIARMEYSYLIALVAATVIFLVAYGFASFNNSRKRR